MKARIKNTVMHNGKRYVCRIFDYGDSVADRYTIALKGYYIPQWRMVYPYLACNAHPYHPQGFGQHGESKTFLTGKHLGKRVRFEDLPEQVKQFIVDNLSN